MVFRDVRTRETAGTNPGKIFLLSPASLNGERAKLLLSPGARSETAQRMRSPEGAPLEEVFTFVSSLYFRGKLTYARHFAAPPAGFPPAGSTLVIAPGFGLVPPDWRIDPERTGILRSTPVDLRCAAYVEPMRRHLEALHANIPTATPVVLLGSIATGKYVDLLLPVFGDRLVFPRCFVGIGDMSRGSVLLNEAIERADYILKRGFLEVRGIGTVLGRVLQYFAQVFHAQRFLCGEKHRLQNIFEFHD